MKVYVIKNTNGILFNKAFANKESAKDELTRYLNSINKKLKIEAAVEIFDVYLEEYEIEGAVYTTFFSPIQIRFDIIEIELVN